jgi:hypothetical protein
MNNLHRFVLTGVAAVVVVFLSDPALAQGVSFGAPHHASAIMPQSGLVAWIFAKQAAFYRSMSSFIRARMTEPRCGTCSASPSFTVSFMPSVLGMARQSFPPISSPTRKPGGEGSSSRHVGRHSIRRRNCRRRHCSGPARGDGQGDRIDRSRRRNSQLRSRNPDRSATSVREGARLHRCMSGTGPPTSSRQSRDIIRCERQDFSSR